MARGWDGSFAQALAGHGSTDWRVLSGFTFCEIVFCGIIVVNRNGLRLRDVHKDDGPATTLCSRWMRLGEMAVFVRMVEGPVAAGADPRTVMIEATCPKEHRTASSLAVEEGGLVA